jgi:hypothetical protein
VVISRVISFRREGRLADLVVVVVLAGEALAEADSAEEPGDLEDRKLFLKKFDIPQRKQNRQSALFA